MIYLYARVSTVKQNLERQIDMLKKEYPDAKLYVDKYTGKRLDRPNFKKMLKGLKAGDMVAFESVDRMSRNAEEGVALYQELYKKGVELVFLKNPNIDTRVYREQIERRVQLETDKKDATGKFINGLGVLLNEFIMDLAAEQVRLAFDKAEEEAQKISRRTKEGLKVAADQGRKGGRVSGQKVTTAKKRKARESILQHSKTFGGSLKDAEVIKLCGVNRNTYYTYKSELIAEQNGDKTVLEIVSE